MGLRADSARPQRVSGSARTDSRRAESARNPIASHVNFGDDSALSAFMRTQWTAAFTPRQPGQVARDGHMIILSPCPAVTGSVLDKLLSPTRVMTGHLV